MISALHLILTGCGNNQDVATNTYNTISGTVADFTTGTVDSLKCFSYSNDLLIGTCAVSNDGNFSIKLPTPSGNRIGKINNVTVSDTNAIVSNIITTKGYKNGIQKWCLYKSNSTNFSRIEIGSTILIFFYSDRDLIIKGTNIISTNKSIIWNVKLRKGWNEMAMNISSDESYSYSTTIPTGLTWRLFPI